MLNIFRSICAGQGLSFYHGDQIHLPQYYDLFFQEHSKFELETLPKPYQGLHLIRDPRDVIVSAAFYHESCKKENWLLQSMKEFEGLSYQQSIANLPSLEKKLEFEMHHCSGNTIRDMLSWNYSNTNFYEAKYEDLVTDTKLIHFHNIFSFLGFSKDHMDKSLQIAFNNSLFSGKKINSHVRSGQPGQWKTCFTKKTYRLFLYLFEDALVQLGYEKNDQWSP
jgi:hypothetical protein